MVMDPINILRKLITIIVCVFTTEVRITCGRLTNVVIKVTPLSGLSETAQSFDASEGSKNPHSNLISLAPIQILLTVGC